MADFLIVAVLALILGAIVLYICKEKKRGTKCIGCPAAKNGTCGGTCSCSGGSCH